MIIKMIISNGQQTQWRDVEVTDVVVMDLSDYDNTKEIDDIDISNEGKPIESIPEKEGNVRYVYDNPNAPTLPPRRKQPWELF
jgi:hypothetical protein